MKKGVFTSWLIPVDTSKTYRVSWDFRNTWLSPTRIYFWIDSYDENKVRITAQRKVRVWNASTITNFDDTTIYTDTILDWWNDLGDANYYYYSIWFYYDWDTTKLPDEVMLYLDTYTPEWRIPAYSSIDWQNILLNRAIPEEIAQNIILWTTKVMNHTSWATYIYTYSTSDLSNDWYSAISSNITWEVFNGWSTEFRIWTKYIKIMLLANWYDSLIDYEIEFDNIHFEEVN